MSLPYTTATTLPWGSFVLSPTTGSALGVSFIAEDFEVTEGTTLAERTTELGAPNGAILIANAKTGRGTLQLAATTTVAPSPGDEFTHTLRSGGSAVTFVITEVGLPEKAKEFKHVQIQFREKA